MTRSFRPTRRGLLGGLGVSAAALPFIPHASSHAGGAQPPRRLVIVYQELGLLRDTAAFSGPEHDFSFNESMQVLEPFRDDLVVLDGLEMQGIEYQGLENDHDQSSPQILCGIASQGTEAGGPSVDQIIADSVGGATVFPSLYLGVANGYSSAPIVATAPHEWVSPIDNPQVASDLLFGGGVDLGELDDLAARRASALARVSDELTALDGLVSGADQRKIDSHRDAIAALEQQLESGCSAPKGPWFGGCNADAADGCLRQMSDLVVSALACDLTRVVVLHVNMTDLPWAGIGDYHQLTHWEAGGGLNGQADALTAAGTWMAEQFAYLLQSLSDVPEGDGRLLDNTLVLWAEEHAVYYGSGAHERHGLHYLLAGNVAGQLQTGRRLDFGGRPHNDLLVSLCHLMGLPEVETVGIEALCDGGLPGLG